MGAAENADGERSQRSLSLTTSGLTLLGVILSIGVTVGFGLGGSWWARVLGGLAAVLVLLAAVKLGSDAGRGPIARFANWVMGADPR